MLLHLIYLLLQKNCKVYLILVKMSPGNHTCWSVGHPVVRICRVNNSYWWKSECPAKVTVPLPSAFQWWMNKAWGQWMMYRGCAQCFDSSFSALTVLVGWQEGNQAVKVCVTCCKGFLPEQLEEEEPLWITADFSLGRCCSCWPNDSVSALRKWKHWWQPRHGDLLSWEPGNVCEFHSCC